MATLRKVFGLIIALSLQTANCQSPSPGLLPAPTSGPSPAPVPTAPTTHSPTTAAPIPGTVATQPSAAPIATSPSAGPAIPTNPAASSAPGDSVQPTAPTIPPTDYPISRCGPVYTNEWCPAGPQGQTLYCSRWGFCGEGNKADEFAGLFIDINAACPSLTDAECKTRNSKYFCYVPEMRCALKVSHDQVKESSHQKSGAVSTSVSAVAFILFIALRFAHI